MAIFLNNIKIVKTHLFFLESLRIQMFKYIALYVFRCLNILPFTYSGFGAKLPLRIQALAQNCPYVFRLWREAAFTYSDV